MTDICDMTATDLASGIAAGRISAQEVMTASLERIARLDGAVNAFSHLRPADQLLEEACAADAARAKGEALGPLHGLPHAVKDLQAVAGLPFTRGSPIFRESVAREDSLMVQRLRAAGAIIIGKTNTPEFGLGSHTFNPVHGLTRNPYDPSRSAGGSSGGAAVALALRLAPSADGSDYGGSLRNPAGWNNVFGLRPSIGRVPSPERPDRHSWSPTMGVLGPMGRSVEDLGLLLSVIAGPDPRAPLCLSEDPSVFRSDLRAEVKGLRLGWLGDFGGAAPCDPEANSVCESGLAAFGDCGCTVEPVALDVDYEGPWRAFIALRAWQAGGALVELYRDPTLRTQLKPEAVYEVEMGLRLHAFDLDAAEAVREVWTRRIRNLFSTFDALLAPTAQTLPFEAAERWPSQIAGRAMTTYHEWMKGVCLISLTGCPSLAVPAGFSSGGLPMGLQIVTPHGAELRALRIARAYAEAAPWTKMRRPDESRLARAPLQRGENAAKP